jgi:hypothetical protein
MVKKRKAQNRAAQRAFRERKEKHLKDLESKVQDLEKASEVANYENSILRAQIEKMLVELREYRKRLSAGGNTRSSPLSGGLPPYLSGKGSNNITNNPNDITFQFEFPKFGGLPSLPVLNATRLVNSSSTTSTPSAPDSGPSIVGYSDFHQNSDEDEPGDSHPNHLPSLAHVKEFMVSSSAFATFRRKFAESLPPQNVFQAREELAAQENYRGWLRNKKRSGKDRLLARSFSNRDIVRYLFGK